MDIESSIIFTTRHERPRMLTNTYECLAITTIIANWWWIIRKPVRHIFATVWDQHIISGEFAANNFFYIRKDIRHSVRVASQFPSVALVSPVWDILHSWHRLVGTVPSFKYVFFKNRSYLANRNRYMQHNFLGVSLLNRPTIRNGQNTIAESGSEHTSSKLSN